MSDSIDGLLRTLDALNASAEEQEREGGMSVRTEEAIWAVEQRLAELRDAEAKGVCPKHPYTTLNRQPCDLCRIEGERIAEWVNRAREHRLPAKDLTRA